MVETTAIEMAQAPADAAPEAPSHVFVVLNPTGGRVDADAVRLALDRHFCPPKWRYELYEVQSHENLRPAVRAALDESPKIVIAAGGDGTVSAVAGELVGTGIPLGIISLGTGNALARELGIPAGLDGACALLAGDNQMVAIDVMKVGKHYCFLNVSTGISALMMRDTPKEAKKRFGFWAYLWTGLRALTGTRIRRVTLEIDGSRHRPRASDIIVVSGAFPEEARFRRNRTQRLDDGIVTVYVLHKRSLLDYLRLAANLIAQNPGYDPTVHSYTAEHSVLIDARLPLPVQADGEPIGQTPVRIDIVKQTLKVVVSS